MTWSHKVSKKFCWTWVVIALSIPAFTVNAEPPNCTAKPNYVGVPESIDHEWIFSGNFLQEQTSGIELSVWTPTLTQHGFFKNFHVGGGLSNFDFQEQGADGNKKMVRNLSGFFGISAGQRQGWYISPSLRLGYLSADQRTNPSSPTSPTERMGAVFSDLRMGFGFFIIEVGIGLKTYYINRTEYHQIGRTDLARDFVYPYLGVSF